MDITERLRRLGVAPCSDTFEARFEVLGIEFGVPFRTRTSSGS